MAKFSDQEIIEGIHKNDPEIKAAFYQFYHKRVAEIVQFYLWQFPQEVEGVINTTFYEAFHSISEDRFDPEKGSSLLAYLVGIAKNSAIQQFKKITNGKFVYHTFADLDKRAYGNPIIIESDLRELRQLLIAALKLLPEHQGRALYLNYFKELSVKEIACQMDVKPQVVSQWIFSGKRNLRKKILKNISKEKKFSILLEYLSIIGWVER